ncbi:MAG: hypothetical protein WC483_00030 [Candidatus Paceibacterota bacterium]
MDAAVAYFILSSTTVSDSGEIVASSSSDDQLIVSLNVLTGEVITHPSPRGHIYTMAVRIGKKIYAREPLFSCPIEVIEEGRVTRLSCDGHDIWPGGRDLIVVAEERRVVSFDPESGRKRDLFTLEPNSDIACTGSSAIGVNRPFGNLGIFDRRSEKWRIPYPYRYASKCVFVGEDLWDVFFNGDDYYLNFYSVRSDLGDSLNPAWRVHFPRARHGYRLRAVAPHFILVEAYYLEGRVVEESLYLFDTVNEVGICIDAPMFKSLPPRIVAVESALEA